MSKRSYVPQLVFFRGIRIQMALSVLKVADPCSISIYKKASRLVMEILRRKKFLKSQKAFTEQPGLYPLQLKTLTYSLVSLMSFQI